jgi:hypothetical protein
MLTMRHHNSHDYAILPNIDDTDAGTITADDQACLDEIGDCLLRAKVHSRFAVTLLHSHFPIDDDEILLEEAHSGEQMITLQPVRVRPSSVFATNVCFDDADTRSGEPRLVGLEFASSQTLAGVAPIQEFDRDVLTSVGAIVRHRERIRRFGIRLLHDPLNLNGGVLLETCDPIHRVLTCRRDTANDLASLQSIPTVFRWEEAPARNGYGLVIGQECIQFCRAVQRCVMPVHGSHSKSSSHEPTGHRSV